MNFDEYDYETPLFHAGFVRGKHWKDYAPIYYHKSKPIAIRVLARCLVIECVGGIIADYQIGIAPSVSCAVRIANSFLKAIGWKKGKRRGLWHG